MTPRASVDPTGSGARNDRTTLECAGKRSATALFIHPGITSIVDGISPFRIVAGRGRRAGAYVPMSLEYLKDAVAANDFEKLIRYVRLHVGDGNEAAGRNEIDKAWVEALKLLLDAPPTDRELVEWVLATAEPATLAHLFFSLHFHLVKHSGAWIHDGQL